jgi:hypothetical protein
MCVSAPTRVSQQRIVSHTAGLRSKSQEDHCGHPIELHGRCASPTGRGRGDIRRRTPRCGNRGAGGAYPSASRYAVVSRCRWVRKACCRRPGSEPERPFLPNWGWIYSSESERHSDRRPSETRWFIRASAPWFNFRTAITSGAECLKNLRSVERFVRVAVP